jgi:hypothetical protein
MRWMVWRVTSIRAYLVGVDVGWVGLRLRHAPQPLFRKLRRRLRPVAGHRPLHQLRHQLVVDDVVVDLQQRREAGPSFSNVSSA